MGIFHLAFDNGDSEGAGAIHGNLPGCTEERSTETRVDFEVLGPRIGLHPGAPFADVPAGKRGDPMVPMPHFGALLETDEGHASAERLTAAGGNFVIAQMMRFEGQPGGQATMFLPESFGDALEFKGMRAPAGSAFAA